MTGQRSCFSPSLGTSDVVAAQWAQDISSEEPRGPVYGADAFIRGWAALRGAVPSQPHRCAAPLLHPLFRGLCWPRQFSFPCRVGFLCSGLLDMGSVGSDEPWC